MGPDNQMSRPLNYDGDPIIRMRYYVRKSIAEKIAAAAMVQKKPPGEIVNQQFQGLVINPSIAGPQTDRGPQNKTWEEDVI